MDHGIVEQIEVRLESLERLHGVAIPLAIESGSRAWGFPSPDSDYDCRFIYVPKVDDALGLFLRRDVIETELTPVFDINGWELRKAVKLMMKGNAVVIEWLNSPFRYRSNDEFHSALLELSQLLFDRGLIANHYRRVMESKREEHFGDPSRVPLKKVLYAVRSALAIRYLRFNHTQNSLPMRLQDLCAGANLTPLLQHEIDALIAAKVGSAELGIGRLAPAFQVLMSDEADAATSMVSKPGSLSPAVKSEAERRYLAILRKFSP